MNISKTGIALGSFTLMAAAYFLIPNENGEPQDNHQNTAAQLEAGSDGQSGVKSFANQTAPIIHARSTQNLKEPNTQSSLNLAIDRRFYNTQDYEAASLYGVLPSYMSDITIEHFSFDENDQLVINEKIKHIIEFFLMATQEEGAEQAIARLKEYITMTLPTEAANEALVIADNYLAFKASLHESEQSLTSNLNDTSTINKLRQTLASQKAKRREHLGESVTQALFGHEESYDDFTLARIEINSDESLDEYQRDQRIAQAENDLPPKLAQSMRYKREEKNLSKKINTLKQQADTSPEIYQLRKDFYGQKVADRMAYLEDSSIEWENKVMLFQREKRQILAQTGLNQTEKKQLLDELKQSSFSHKEQIKLAVQSVRGRIAQAD